MSAAKKIIAPKDLMALLDPKFSKASSLVSEPEKAAGHILTTEGAGLDKVLDFVLSKKVTQICQESAGSLAPELNSSALMLQNPDTFFNFPVSSILSPATASAAEETRVAQISMKFQKAAEKSPALDQIRQLLETNQKSESLINDAVLIADEMFTNAVFNAPFVDLRTGFNPGVDRSDWSVAMDSTKFGELMIGFDDERLVIACRDPYGSLDTMQFFKRVQECLRKGVSATMRMGTGGAGIGSYMVLNLASSLYVGVKRGTCTIVAVTIQWKWSGRRRSESVKNVHFIVS